MAKTYQRVEKELHQAQMRVLQLERELDQAQRRVEKVTLELPTAKGWWWKLSSIKRYQKFNEVVKVDRKRRSNFFYHVYRDRRPLIPNGSKTPRPISLKVSGASKQATALFAKLADEVTTNRSWDSYGHKQCRVTRYVFNGIPERKN